MDDVSLDDEFAVDEDENPELFLDLNGIEEEEDDTKHVSFVGEMEASIESLSQFTEGSVAKTTLPSALKPAIERHRGNDEGETTAKRRSTRAKQNLPTKEVVAGTMATVSSTLTNDAILVLVGNRNAKSAQLIKYLEEGKEPGTALHELLVQELLQADAQLGKAIDALAKSSRTERR